MRTNWNLKNVQQVFIRKCLSFHPLFNPSWLSLPKANFTKTRLPKLLSSTANGNVFAIDEEISSSCICWDRDNGRELL